jgi:outer membrane protein
MKRSSDEDKRIAGMVKWAAVLWPALCVIGCGTPEVPSKPELAALAAKTHQIESVQLTEQSKSPPMTIEQATREVVKEVTGPNQPRPMLKLTLEEVRAAALANNLDLKVRLISPTIAQQTVDIERAKFESVFRTSAQYGTTALSGDGSLSRWSLDAGTFTPLWTGGSITTDVPVEERGGVAAATASVSVIQSLLRGAGTQVNLYSIEVAGYNKGAVDAATKFGAINILGGADIAYWRLYRARKLLEISREQYKVGQNQLRNARYKVEAGSAPKIEIVYAEAGLADRLDAMITTETEVRSLERDLKRIMNRPDLPISAPVDINTVSQPDPKGLDLDPEALIRVALENRMDLAELEFDLAIDDIQIARSRNDLLPLLSLEYSYAADAQAGNVGGAFQDLFHHPTQDHQVGLFATIPLGNRAAEARLRQVRLQKMQDQVNREQQEQEIRQEIYGVVDNLEQNWRRILAAEQGVVSALRNYRVRQSQFQVGRTDSTEVLRAADGLAGQQSRRISSYADYEMAQVLLARATGTLLGRGRIQLKPAALEGK